MVVFTISEVQGSIYKPIFIYGTRCFIEYKYRYYTAADIIIDSLVQRTVWSYYKQET